MEQTIPNRVHSRWHVCLEYPYSSIFVVAAVILAVPMCLRQPRDWFEVYVVAAGKLWTGEALYPNNFGYAYPPAFAMFAGVFLGMPTLFGRVIWHVINMVALAFVLRGAWSLAGAGRAEPTSECRPRTHAMLILGLLCGIFFAFDNLSNQQTDLILAALCIGGCQLLARGRDLSAAMLFGLAAALKCTPLLWSGYLLWRRKWVASALVVVAAIAFNLLPDVIVPSPHSRPRLLEWTSQYLSGVATRDVGVWLSAVNYNHSIAGVANRLALFQPTWHGADMEIAARAGRPSPLVLKAIAYGTALAMIALTLLASWRSRQRLATDGDSSGRLTEALEYSLVFMLMLLLSPMSSKPHFCTLFLPGFCLARLALQRRDRVIKFLLGAAIVAGLVSNKDLVGEQVYDFMIWYGSVFWSCVLLFAGCCYALLVEPKARAKVFAGPLTGVLRSAA